MTFKHSLSNRVVLLCALERHPDFPLNLLDADMLVLTFLFSLAHYKVPGAVCEYVNAAFHFIYTAEQGLFYFFF